MGFGINMSTSLFKYKICGFPDKNEKIQEQFLICLDQSMNTKSTLKARTTVDLSYYMTFRL
jgi:hypothetical protein